jgi:hypothetical protein
MVGEYTHPTFFWGICVWLRADKRAREGFEMGLRRGLRQVIHKWNSYPPGLGVVGVKILKTLTKIEKILLFACIGGEKW